MEPAQAVAVLEPGWQDVQPLLAAASEQLQLGELLHGEEFSMFEAMSAVEIGDPKLDAGLTVDYLVPADRPPSEEAAPQWPSSAAALAVMDRLAALEATWHADHSLAQTVFTCLYLLHPQRLDGHLVVSGYCRAVRATCGIVRDTVLAGCVCEDEDFQPHAYGLMPASAAEGGPTALAALSLAEDWLTGRSHPGLNTTPGRGRDPGHSVSGSGVCNGGGPQANGSVNGAADAGAKPGVDVRAEHVAGFLARVRFRRALLRGLQRMAAGTRGDLDAARKQLLAAQAELARVRASGGGGVPAEQAPGFDPDVNRRLMAPVPPRPIQVLSTEETWDYWAGALAQLLRVCDVARCARWADLKPYLLDCAAALPGALARSALHCAVSGRRTGQGGGSGGTGSRSAGAEAQQQPWQLGPAMVCEAVGLPAAGLPGPEAQLFVDQAVIALQGWCQAMCLNRARQRRRHRRAIEDWAFLHQHALNAEASPDFAAWLPGSGWAWQGEQAAPGPLAAWVVKECSGVLLQHLLLGFELGVYAAHEHCMLFWYCDYLFGTLHQAALALIAARPAPGSALPPWRGPSPKSSPVKGPPTPAGRGAGAAGAKGKGAGKRAAAGRAGGPPPTDLLSEEALEASLERTLCQAHMRLAAGLARAGRLRPGGGPFNAESQRFEQRFSALHRLAHPEPLDYDQFASAVDATDCRAADLLLSALAGFAAARRALLPVAAAAEAAVATAGSDGGAAARRAARLRGWERAAARNAVALRVLVPAVQAEEAGSGGSDPTGSLAGPDGGRGEPGVDGVAGAGGQRTAAASGQRVVDLDVSEGRTGQAGAGAAAAAAAPAESAEAPSTPCTRSHNHNPPGEASAAGPAAKAEQRLSVGWDSACTPYPVLTLSHVSPHRPGVERP